MKRTETVVELDPSILEKMEPVSDESLRRAAEADARVGGNGGGNLIAAIQDHADKEIARLEQEVKDLVGQVRAKNERIAALKTHAAISPKDDGGRG